MTVCRRLLMNEIKQFSYSDLSLEDCDLLARFFDITCDGDEKSIIVDINGEGLGSENI